MDLRIPPPSVILTAQTCDFALAMEDDYMADAVDHEGDLKKYCANADAAHIAAVRKYLGIALTKKDSSLVSCSDAQELARIRDGYAKKKLGLSDDKAIDAAIKNVCAAMKGDNSKSRIAFYYLLAQETGTLSKLA